MQQALIIDVSAKQEYIFSSNKLRLNLGASHIISKKIFGSLLESCLGELQKNQLELVNAGGGNAILYFENIVIQKTFVTQYTEKVLRHYPGLQIELGSTTIEEGVSFQDIRNRLVANKNERRSRFYFPSEVDLGIAKACPLTGKPQNEIYKGNSISAEAKSKYIASDDAKEQLNEEFNELLGDRYTFSSEGKDIAPEEEKSFLAVVHVDGNRIGEFFKDKSKEEFQIQSKLLDQKLNSILKRIIRDVIKLISVNKEREPEIIDDEGEVLILLKKDSDKIILPFRSIINAGDDITFIAHGKLGICLARRYIQYLEEAYTQVVDGKEERQDGIKACAGIAIIHTPHPFYKAYKMAEALCQQAKVESRKDGESRLSYMIFKEGISGTLDDILDWTFRSGQYNFKRKSLRLQSNFSLNKLIEVKKKLERWPRSKVHQLYESVGLPDSEFDFRLRKMGTSEDRDKYEKAFKNFDCSREELFEVFDLLEFYPNFESM